jgi:lipoprotein-anchoring transpeptidase ErfK/SrfK
MNIVKSLVAAVVSAALAIPLMVAPVSAAIVWRYDHREQKFFQVDTDALPATRGGSPIKKEIIDFETTYKVGTIIVDTSDRRLYLVMDGGKALMYGVGVGREGFTWQGTNKITRKAEWPGWTPPAAMRARVPGLPAYMPGGPENPLGARALYIGSTLYRLHGTAEPWTIGTAVSSGCIRLTNDDITDLYERVTVGTTVVVRS